MSNGKTSGDFKKTHPGTVVTKKKKKPLKSKTKLTGRELHHYLDSKIVRDTTLSNPTIHPRPDLLQHPATGSLHEIIPSIKNRLKDIGRLTAKCARLYFELGSYLQTAFKIWSFSKQRDEITGTWNQFLASTFGISGSYSRQLRKVSKKLGVMKGCAL